MNAIDNTKPKVSMRSRTKQNIEFVCDYYCDVDIYINWKENTTSEHWFEEIDKNTENELVSEKKKRALVFIIRSIFQWMLLQFTFEIVLLHELNSRAYTSQTHTLKIQECLNCGCALFNIVYMKCERWKRQAWKTWKRIMRIILCIAKEDVKITLLYNCFHLFVCFRLFFDKLSDDVCEKNPMKIARKKLK